jgi:hypothetical protein
MERSVDAVFAQLVVDPHEPTLGENGLRDLRSRTQRRLLSSALSKNGALDVRLATLDST